MATGANTTPLGRPNPALGAGSQQHKPSGFSLLKPTYLAQSSGSSNPPSHQPPQHHQPPIQHHHQPPVQHHHQLSPLKAHNIPPPTLHIPPQSLMSQIPHQPQQQHQQLVGLHFQHQPPPAPIQSQPTASAPMMMLMSKREYDHDSSSNDSDVGKKKKRRSRWGNDEKEKAFIPGMPTVIPGNLSKNQEKAYLLQLQIEELSRRLRTGDLGILPNPEERSPSPEPIYNNEGKRLNTREYRTRKKLEDERHHLIQQMVEVNPEFKPPADYKPPVVRVSDKVMIPQEEHPDINFVGLLIGPRGNTLKSMEKTGAKIIIRGKGSVKEGKVSRKDGQPLPGEDEPLHAYVTANNAESVRKAVEKIKEIIRQGVEVPEGQNDLRRMQLRELALLNGTLRENDGPRCTNCGASNHKSWQCPDKPNITNSVICSSCGGAGHIAKDCRERRPGSSFGGGAGGGGAGGGGGGGGSASEKSKIDEEYMSLMAELGEGPPPPAKSGAGGGHHRHHHSSNLFGGHQGAPHAIMAPPPSPSSQNSHNHSQPPALLQHRNYHVGRHVEERGSHNKYMPDHMSQNIQPPWNQGHGKSSPGMGMNNNGGGSNHGSMGQHGGSPWHHMPQSSMGHHGSFPGMLGQPPPPPPGSQAPGAGMSWMQQSGMQWQQHPAPVPPPRPGAMTPAHWSQAFVGVPPPPPPMVTGAGTVDLNVLAQAGLPNLLAAPPPPPPPPS